VGEEVEEEVDTDRWQHSSKPSHWQHSSKPSHWQQTKQEAKEATKPNQRQREQKDKTTPPRWRL